MRRIRFDGNKLIILFKIVYLSNRFFFVELEIRIFHDEANLSQFIISIYIYMILSET